MKLFLKLLKREGLIQLRQIRYLINFCLFFLIMIFIFPLTLRPELGLLRAIVPGLVWVAGLLALLMSAERLFTQDYEQGIIEQWLVSGRSMTVFVGAKLLMHWLLTLVPILILTPLIALLFALNPWEAAVLALSFLCGSPALLLLCALASSFGLNLHQKGALMALILIPLSLPILVFGSGSLTVAMQDLPIRGYLALLLAISVLTIGFLPYAIGSILRISHAD